MKSVKLLVLCKGGNNLSITSYGFYNQNKTTTIPLEMVSKFIYINIEFGTELLPKLL